MGDEAELGWGRGADGRWVGAQTQATLPDVKAQCSVSPGACDLTSHVSVSLPVKWE